MLRVSRPALRADFQHYYGLNLRTVLTGTEWSLPDVGDLAVELPRGARIWVHMGGPAAVSYESEMLMAVEYQILGLQYQWGGSKGEPPKFRDYPESATAIEAQQQKVTDKAARWKQRHMAD